MTQEQILSLLENKKDEIEYYNNDCCGKFATNVLDRLILEIKES